MADDPKHGADTPTKDGEPPKGDPNPKDGEERDGEKGTDWKKVALGYKDKVEKFNEVDKRATQAEERATRLEQELQAIRRAAAGDSRPNDDDDEEDADIERWAADGHPLAKALVKQKRQSEKLTQNVIFATQIRDMPKEIRAKVWEHFQAHRHKFVDPEMAKADLDAAELGGTVKNLEKELEDTKKQLAAALKEPPKGVKTSLREGPEPDPNAETMTVADFDAEQIMLKSQGRHKEAMQRQRDLRDDKIVLQG